MKKTIAGLFIAAGLVYGIRWYMSAQQQRKPFLYEATDGRLAVREEVVDAMVLAPNQQILQQSLNTLLVFIDPERVCPSGWEEVPTWVEPYNWVGAGVYQVLVWIPVHPKHSEDHLYEFLIQSGIPTGNIHRYEMGGVENNFSQFGMFKLLYRLDAGVVFFEIASEREADPNQFSMKLRQAVVNES